MPINQGVTLAILLRITSLAGPKMRSVLLWKLYIACSFSIGNLYFNKHAKNIHPHTGAHTHMCMLAETNFLDQNKGIFDFWMQLVNLPCFFGKDRFMYIFDAKTLRALMIRMISWIL